MLEVSAYAGPTSPTVDVCKNCEFIWFDAAEFEVAPAAPPPPPSKEELDRKLPQAAREAIAMAQVEQMAETSREQDRSPDAQWKAIPAMFGLPVEVEDDNDWDNAWVTICLSSLIIIVSVVAFHNLRGTIDMFGLKPAEMFRYGGATVLTSFFLHGGVWHLVSNVYFLWLVGNNVENYLGRWRFVALIVAALLLGDVLHILADPHSTTPCVGASGGIAGVMAFYALQFPKNRLGFLVRYTWVQTSAGMAFVLWLGLQFFVAMKQYYGVSKISGMAHLGGALAGAMLWVVWRTQSGFSPAGVVKTVGR
jgi:membrane associated rhomboid family serine protease